VLRVDFVYVPTTQAARPLWRPFITGALGAVVIDGSDSVLNLARFCAFEMRLPIVFATKGASNGSNVHEALPPSLRAAPLGAAVVSTDISAAVRTLLLAAMTAPNSGELTRA